MKLYFKDTAMSYKQISDLLTTHVGPSGPSTWQNGSEYEFPDGGFGAFRGYVEIYDEHPAAVFVKLKW
jgi:hypothetical protein